MLDSLQWVFPCYGMVTLATFLCPATLSSLSTFNYFISPQHAWLSSKMSLPCILGSFFKYVPPQDAWMWKSVKGGVSLFGWRFNSWTSIRGFFASDIWQLLVFWSFCHKPAVDAVHYIVGRGCLNFVGGQVTAEVVRISLVGSYREHLVVPLYVLVEVLGAKEEHWHGPLSWQEYSADVSLVPPNPRDLE